MKKISWVMISKAEIDDLRETSDFYKNIVKKSKCILRSKILLNNMKIKNLKKLYLMK